jgi:predicted transcriptional regulator of viral defense system
MEKVNYLDFKSKLFETGSFCKQDVLAYYPDFEWYNINQWKNKGYLIHLHQGYYAFPEYLLMPDFKLYSANHYIKPSYISLQSALAFYGILKKAPSHVTSVTSLYTCDYKNVMGSFILRKIRKDLMFGYDLKPITNGKMILVAKPEKALLDLLFLLNFYISFEDMKRLKLNKDFMQNEFDWNLMQEYLIKFKSKFLEKRVDNLIEVYKYKS